MKEFFGDLIEDLGKRIGETAEVVANKAGEALEIERLKGQIRDFSRGNAVDLMEIGKLVYENYKNGEDVGEEAAALCSAIEERKANITEYERKIAVIKGARECQNCGKMVSKEMAFCPYCGEKVEEPSCGDADESCFEDEVVAEACASEEEAAETCGSEAKEEGACGSEAQAEDSCASEVETEEAEKTSGSEEAAQGCCCSADGCCF